MSKLERIGQAAITGATLMLCVFGLIGVVLTVLGRDWPPGLTIERVEMFISVGAVIAAVRAALR